MDRTFLSKIYTFCNAFRTTRNMVEKKDILDSGNIINCVDVNKDFQVIDLFAICLQTSAIKEKPHEFTGHLLNINSG